MEWDFLKRRLQEQSGRKEIEKDRRIEIVKKIEKRN